MFLHISGRAGLHPRLPASESFDFPVGLKDTKSTEAVGMTPLNPAQVPANAGVITSVIHPSSAAEAQYRENEAKEHFKVDTGQE